MQRLSHHFSLDWMERTRSWRPKTATVFGSGFEVKSLRFYNIVVSLIFSGPVLLLVLCRNQMKVWLLFVTIFLTVYKTRSQGKKGTVPRKISPPKKRFELLAYHLPRSAPSFAMRACWILTRRALKRLNSYLFFYHVICGVMDGVNRWRTKGMFSPRWKWKVEEIPLSLFPNPDENRRQML